MKRKFLSILFALVLVASFSLVTAVPAVAAGDFYVPTGYSTIQEAINAASAAGGGTVHVAAGTYNERITLKDGVDVLGAGQGISIISGVGLTGPLVTAIDIDSGETLDGFTITGGSTTAGGGGAGMYNDHSSPTVSNCTFSGNTATNGSGGGMHNLYSSPTVTNCTFSGNTAGSGGGMENYMWSSPTVTSCIFRDHVITGNGGGMRNDDGSSPALANCIFAKNSAGIAGGMFNAGGSDPTVVNCTFYSNSALMFAGGMHSTEDCLPTVTNSVFWYNTGWQIGQDEPWSTTITYSNLENYWKGEGGIGNISQEPKFVDRVNYNYHLQPRSLCIDAGSNAAAAGLTDFGGEPRTVDGNGDGNVVVDMGAYEFQPDSVTNDPPVLSGGAVNPPTGDVTTPSFTYSVTYTDAEGHAPLLVTVSIDGGTAQPMDVVEGNYATGVSCTYTSGGLAKGSHTYQFAASDGIEAATVGTDIVSGPTIENSLPNAPQSPVCEGLTNPTEVTDPTPEFGWTFSDPDPGDTQGAYQILVTSGPGGTGDIMWGPGKVTSDASEVSYAGTALAWNTTYYWKVKTWDSDGAEGVYCAEQQFTTLQQPPNAPDSPLCEGVAAPTGVTDPTPEFGWTFSDPDPGDTQGAYQILVTSGPGGTGDIMWDPGKVTSDASEVSYAGTALAWNTTYYWKVKTWDSYDAEGVYCAEQQFTTGSPQSEVWVDDDWAVLSHGDPAGDYTFNTDAFANIQDGIDIVAPEGTVNVAAGTYNENVVIDKTLTLEGAQAGVNARGRTGPESIINAQGVPIAVLINGADTVATFDGFRVVNYDTIGILAGAFKDVLQEVPLGDDPVTVHILNNVVMPPTVAPPHNNNIQIGDGTTGTIIGNDVSGALLESPEWSGSGILVASSSNVVISNNYVYNSEGGIQILGYAEYQGRPAAEDNVIENNLVEGNECGISVQGNSISTIIRYNDVLNNDVGIGSMAYDLSWPEHSTPSGTQIHYNNMDGNLPYGVESVVWGSHWGTVLAEQVDATLNWWGDATGPKHATENPCASGDEVSDNVDYIPWLDAAYPGGTERYHNVENITQVTTHNSIQSAIDSADPGDTISVAAGTYKEAVFIDKGLTLNGAKPGVDARTRDTSSGESILDGTGIDPAATYPYSTGITIGDAVSNVVIDGFEITNFTRHPIDGGYGSGILVWRDTTGGETGANANIIIQNNYLHDLGWNGVCVGTGGNGLIHTGITIQFNLIEEAPYAGIELTNVTNSQVLSNKIMAPTSIVNDPGDAGVGIEIAVRAHPSITISAGNALVEGNEITGAFPMSSRAGINILSRTYALDSNATLTGVTVRGNTVSIGTDAWVAIVAIAEGRDGGPATITNLAVEDNTVYGNYEGIDVDEYGSGTLDSITVTGNTLEDNIVHVYDRGAEVLEIEAVLDSNTFDRTVVAYHLGSLQHFIAGSIHEGCNWAETGATVLASPGTYDEQVYISRSLTLQGAGDTTVIKPSSESRLIHHLGLNAQPGALWNNDQITGIVYVFHPAVHGPVIIKDLKVDGENIEVAPLNVDYVAGIYGWLVDVTIDNVTVVNMDTSTEQPRTYGMWLDSVEPLNYDASVEVKNCTITGYNTNGINARGARQTVDIHDNIITGPSPSSVQVPNGILLANGVQGTVGPNNTISSHQYTELAWTACGICLWDVSGIVMEQNNISDCGSGIGLSGDPTQSQGTIDTIIRENTITGCDRALYLECPDTANNAITSNNLQGNNYGIYLGGSEDPLYEQGEEVGPGNQAHFNNITGNAEYGVVNFTPEVTFDATNNWWGDASGPSGEGTGTGDAVSTNVDFDPWLYPPTVVTAAASSLSTTSATLNGSLDDLGSALSVEVSFEWGTTTAYGNIVAVATPLSEAGVFSATLSGLSDDTTYHFRVKAVGDGPDVYGDDITFTTKRVTAPTPPTYYTETSLFGTEASFPISSSGKILETIEATSADGNLTITIPKDTVALDKDGKRLETLEVAVNETPPDPPEDARIIGLAYVFSPEGATFDPPITFTWSYDPDALPEGVAEEDLVLAYYDEDAGEWVELDCVVDTVNNTITASVAHFTTFAIIGTEEEEVAPPPAPAVFIISSLGISPSELAPGEEVNISVLVANTGGKSGSYSVVLNINGVKEQEKSVTITAGSSQTVTFSVTKEGADTYAVTVDGLIGSFTVVPVVVPPEPAAFSVSYLSVSPRLEVEPGETVAITVLVANTGGESGSYTVVLKVNGVKEAEKTVTIAAGESEEVSFSVTREEAGSYTVDVDGLSGSFTVVLPIKPPGINWPLIGGIIGGVIVAGLLYYFLVFRRRAY